jgi:hypothetical protein
MASPGGRSRDAGQPQGWEEFLLAVIDVVEDGQRDR